MSTLPASGYLSNAARTVGEMKTGFEDVRGVVAELLGGGAETTLTIAAGSVTATVGVHAIDTEAAASTDDLDAIAQTNHPDGRLLLIHSKDNARTVVVRHAIGGAGQFLLADAANLSLTSTKMWLLLKRTGTSWEEVCRHYGDKKALARSFLQIGNEVLAKSANYTVVSADRSKLVDCTGTFNLALDAAATLGDGFALAARNSGTGIVTIDPNAAEQIDGAATVTLLPGESCVVFCNGSAFKTAGRAKARWTTVSKSGASTIAESDWGNTFLCAGTWTYALTAAATLGNGFPFFIRNDGTGIITLDPNGAETIDGATTLALGPGQSALVVCDGANWKTIGLSSVGRHTIYMPAHALIARTTNGPADGKAELTNNKNMVKSFDFDTATEEFVQFEFGSPAGWDAGVIRFKVRWTATGGAGGVAWGFQAVATSDDDAMDVAFGTEVVVTDTFIAANDDHHTAESADVTIAGAPVAGDRVQAQVSRNVADAADTIAQDVKLLGIWVFMNLKRPTDN